MKLSDRPLAGRPDDLAAENRELHRLRAQRQAVLELCAATEHGALRWEHPLPVPEWVERVRAAVGAA